MSNFAFRVLELEPDLAIFYEAANDTLTRVVDPNCYRGENIIRGLDPRQRVPRSDYFAELSPSVLYRFVSINLGWTRNPVDLDSLFDWLDYDCTTDNQANNRTPAENVAANPPVYYRRNLESLVGIADVHDVDLMFASWGYLESSPQAEPYWRDAVDEYNGIVRELADTYSIPFFDYAPLVPQDESYWDDYIHLNGAGSRLQAAQFAAFIDANRLILPAGEN
jgi:lysophospholipase L1-like esterase